MARVYGSRRDVGSVTDVRSPATGRYQTDHCAALRSAFAGARARELRGVSVARPMTSYPPPPPSLRSPPSHHYPSRALTVTHPSDVFVLINRCATHTQTVEAREGEREKRGKNKRKKTAKSKTKFAPANPERRRRRIRRHRRLYRRRRHRRVVHTHTAHYINRRVRDTALFISCYLIFVFSRLFFSFSEPRPTKSAVRRRIEHRRAAPYRRRREPGQYAIGCWTRGVTVPRAFGTAFAVMDVPTTSSDAAAHIQTTWAAAADRGVQSSPAS